MKRFVNGDEAELADSGYTVEPMPDRLIVHGSDGSFTALAVREQDAVLVSYKGRQYRIESRKRSQRSGSSSSSGELVAPMPGVIVDVRVDAGAHVEQGDVLVVLEAMKTQQPFAAPFAGTVKKLGVVKGEQVSDGQLLALVERSDG